MIKVDGVLYYSCNELANALNNPNPRRPLENDLKEAWGKYYGRSFECYNYSSFVQGKLYPAVRNNQIKYLKYKKTNSGRDFIAFAIQDILNYMNEFDYPMTRGFKKITDMQIVDVQNVRCEG